MSDVFISYSRKDIAFARLIREALQQSDRRACFEVVVHTAIVQALIEYTEFKTRTGAARNRYPTCINSSPKVTYG